MGMSNCLGMRPKPDPDVDLLPGIVNHIVMNEIVPKLEWIDFHILSFVSRAWKKAVRSRQVAESRVFFKSSPDTVVGCYVDGTVTLYSIRQNSTYTLPPIAADIRQVPKYAQCISMDGKIYVFGGNMSSGFTFRFTRKMFVFDLAAGGKWKRCASMKQGRRNFGTFVKDGKIYVFGGLGRKSILKSEVYDPKDNTWSRIRATMTNRNYPCVTQIGEALCIHGGLRKNTYVESLEAYHPFKDQWRVLHRDWNWPKHGVVFTSRGNVFSIQHPRNTSLLDINKYDVHQNCWKQVNSVSLVQLIPIEYRSKLVRELPHAALAVNDEVILILSCFPRTEEQSSQRSKRSELYLFQSTGFGSKMGKISWKLRAITFEQRPGPKYSQQYFVQML